ncbi:hypothetical protein E4T42_01962 [Aureobasidium subglaciale]|nr:hypothetical protein E4T42_01962 [Aureobasidium subglaciale]
MNTGDQIHLPMPHEGWSPESMATLSQHVFGPRALATASAPAISSDPAVPSLSATPYVSTPQAVPGLYWQWQATLPMAINLSTNTEINDSCELGPGAIDKRWRQTIRLWSLPPRISVIHLPSFCSIHRHRANEHSFPQSGPLSKMLKFNSKLPKQLDKYIRSPSPTLGPTSSLDVQVIQGSSPRLIVFTVCYITNFTLPPPIMAPQTPTSSPKSSSSPRSPKFSWSHKHRQALLVLYTSDIDNDNVASAFNKLFHEELRTRGFTDGLSKSAINAQYSKSYRTSCAAWQLVEASHKSELEWVTKKLRSIDITASPPSAAALPTASTVRSGQPTLLNNRRRHSATTTTSVSVVIDAPRRNTIASTQPSPRITIASRKVFKRFPEDLISTNRTRTMFGEQVPIIRATDEDLIVNNPITSEEAHSAVPELLFRFYDDDSQGCRTKDGFLSGYYAYLTVPPPSPPPCTDDRLFATILHHLNKVRFSSELISTTSNLFFALRLAAKSNANPRICIIRGSAIPQSKIYHALPFHQRYKAERMFYNGTYMNPSSHEYLIWATLSHTAILADFSFLDFEATLARNPMMEYVFRIQEMKTKKGNTHILKIFEKEKLGLSMGIVDGLARMMPQLGIAAGAPGAVIARFVSEIIRGFKIDLLKTTPQRWQMLAGAFAYAMTDQAKYRNVDEAWLVRIQEAFLSGARTGIGELNWHLNAQKQTRMLSKSVQLGLGAPAASNIDQTASVNRRVDKQRSRAIESTTYKDARLGEEEKAKIDRQSDQDNNQEMVNQDVSDEDSLDHSNDTTIDEEELETDIEEGVLVLDSQRKHSQHRGSQRRAWHPREVTSRSSKVDKDIIIIEDSDDEDYVVDSDMEY